MKPQKKVSEKWQLRQWPKGVPYGSAPGLNFEQIKSIRRYLIERMSRNTGKRDLLIFDLLLNTGCYIGELYNLKMSDLVYGSDDTKIPAARKQIVFMNSEVSKVRKDRVMPVSPSLKRSIEKNADIARNWVCWSQLLNDDLRMGKIHLTYLIHSWSMACGVKIRAHSFRKTFMRRLYENGANVETMLRISGHKSVQSLAQYFEPKPDNYEKEPFELFQNVYSETGDEDIMIKKV